MSAAEKYAGVPSLPVATRQQAADIGKVLEGKGVSADAPAPTVAQKYGAPANNHHGRSLSQGRSL